MVYIIIKSLCCLHPLVRICAAPRPLPATPPPRRGGRTPSSQLIAGLCEQVRTPSMRSVTRERSHHAGVWCDHTDRADWTGRPRARSLGGAAPDQRAGAAGQVCLPAWTPPVPSHRHRQGGGVRRRFEQASSPIPSSLEPPPPRPLPLAPLPCTEPSPASLQLECNLNARAVDSSPWRSPPPPPRHRSRRPPGAAGPWRGGRRRRTESFARPGRCRGRSTAATRAARGGPCGPEGGARCRAALAAARRRKERGGGSEGRREGSRVMTERTREGWG